MPSAVSHPAVVSRETRALNPLWLIILVTLLVFANAIQAPFVWEDKELVLENRFIRSFSSAKFFFLPSYWRECHVAPGMAYKPVTMWSYALDFQLWGLRPWGYHLTNVALHAANALLLFALARGLKLGGSAALATTLLFAVHPLHTETVDWVKNRADLLSTLFLLAAFVLFVRWRPPDGASRGALSYWASLAAFALAAMSKGAGLALCPVLAFYVLLFLPRRDWRTALAATAPFWALAVAYLVNLAFLMQCRLQLTVMTGASETGVTGVLGAVAGYLQLLALPVRLAADRASAAELSLAPGTLAALALATALACLAACR
ncbi:MAG: hypothetical protein FJ279_34425, partial [Planctomycetes bacterium]|nr:hypothetical protein [Planctomycetota bacterium]